MTHVCNRLRPITASAAVNIIDGGLGFRHEGREVGALDARAHLDLADAVAFELVVHVREGRVVREVEAQPGIGLALRKEILRQRGIFTDAAVRPPAPLAPESMLRLLPAHLDALPTTALEA